MTWYAAHVIMLVKFKDEIQDSYQQETEHPTDGTEITYSDMEVSSHEDFEKLLNGESVTVIYH